MERSIIKSSFYANYRICSQRSFLNAFLQTFFDSREVVLRYGTTNYYLFEYIWSFQITGWLKTHLNMSILSMSAGLFLMFAFYVRVLADGLTESNLRLGKFNFYFVAFFQFADYNVEMLIAHTVKKRLSVGRIIYYAKCLIFACHFCKRLCNLVFVAFLDSFVSLISIWCRDHCFRIKNRRSFGCKAVTCLHACKFGNRADITCMKFRNFDRFGTFKYIKFVQTFFNTLFYIEQSIIRFDNTGCNLNERILAEERICDCFPYICRFGF